MRAIGRVLAWVGVAAALACGADSPSGEGGATAAPEAQPAAAPAVQPTGNVVEVKMVTDGEGNYFEPADLTVKRGDVVRFVLVSGVHNVSFPAETNPGRSGLPEASAYLQLPGQSYDLTVGMEPGRYAYQCDPHAALGMVGTLTVER